MVYIMVRNLHLPNGKRQTLAKRHDGIRVLHCKEIVVVTKNR
jgi:hypothetical protein